MKLIIDINDNEYEGIKGYPDNITSYPVTIHLYDAVRNGTPLDKHDEEIIAETVESIWGKPPYTELLDRLTADLESLREPTEPHLVDYRYHRNDMLDAALGVIERYKGGE